MKTVREAALFYTGDDAECTQTKVDLWPEAAKQTIKALMDELEETEEMLYAARALLDQERV